MTGNVVDRLSRMQEPVTDAFIDSLIGTYTIVPAHATVFPFAGREAREALQEPFAKAIRGYYDAVHPLTQDARRKLMWCAITKSYHDSAHMKTAHIVPHAILEHKAQYLFGPMEGTMGHLYNVRNGLPLHEDMEVAMDKARFAIVPFDEEHPSASRLKIVVFDKTFLKEFPPGTTDFPWEKLDGMELSFRNNNRPALRCLYFHFLMCIFRRRRYEVRDWENDLYRYVPARQMWASPGKWFRGSTLKSLAWQVVHIRLPEGLGTSDLATFDPPDGPGDDTLVADVIDQAYDDRERAHDEVGEEEEDEGGK